MPPAPRSPDHIALGRAVRELRARLGLSQEELGYRSRVHRNYVGAVERGELNPTFGVLLRLGGGLGLPLSELCALAEQRVAAVRAPTPRRATHTSTHRARLLPLWDGRLSAARDRSG